MRTLEDLGISPAPWKTFEDNWIDSADGNPVMSNAAYACNKNDARLIAAAPDCYDALQRIISATEGAVMDFPKWQKDLQNALDDARKALAKASGEEVK